MTSFPSRGDSLLTIDTDSDGVHDAGATPWHTFAATEAAAAADQALAVTAASEARTQTTAQAEMDYRFALADLEEVLANNRATDQAQQQIADQQAAERISKND